MARLRRAEIEAAYAVEVVDLLRVYRTTVGREVRALDGLSMTVAFGEVYGLLGPNGAGKTTLVRILATALTPSGSSAVVHGYDVLKKVEEVRKLIGVVFGGDRGFYNQLTGRQNLEYWAALYDLPRSAVARRVDYLLERVSLSSKAGDLVETYSRGMRQRLHLARALIADPAVLFLDEPTIGMDPVAAQSFRELIGETRKERRAILLTTHDMREAERLCDKVALIDRGKLMAVESPSSLARFVSANERIEFETQDLTLLERVRNYPGVHSLQAIENARSYRIEVREPSDTSGILMLLVGSGVTAVRTTRPSLDEVYLRLFGENAQAVAEASS